MHLVFGRPQKRPLQPNEWIPIAEPKAVIDKESAGQEGPEKTER